MTRQETIEKATKWMEGMANDPKHGYDQTYRWGQKGDYDCSAAVITAWDKAGVDLKNDGVNNTGVWPKKGGANTSYDIGPVLVKKGFKDISKEVDFATGKGLKRGDVLVAKGHHVAMYSGNGKEVEASINENRKATGGKPGDQTGREFLIRSYRNYPWTNVYRYEGGMAEKTVVKKVEKADSKPISIKKYSVTAGSGLNLRQTPGGKIITAVPKGTILTKDSSRKSDGDWVPVIYKDKKVYCSKKWLKEV